MSDLDDEFMAQAREAEAQEKERQTNRGGSYTYENVKYAGLEKRIKLFRFVGPHWDPNLGGTVPKVSPTEARVVRIAKLLDDKGKTMRMVLPLFERDEGKHPLIRLIQKVNDGEWIPDPAGTVDKNTGKIKNIKVYHNLTRHPEIFKMVNSSGLELSDNRVKYGLEGKGWSGKEFLVANVIDRELMKWHRENKHTAVLSKSVTLAKKPDESGKIREYPEPGVPAYGFTMMINSNFRKYYGNWENYDIGIERTGITTPPYNMFPYDHPGIKNDPKLSTLVGPKGPLTEEEASWECYDLDKICGVTSFTKILNRLGKSLQKVDLALGTHFFEEVEAFAKQEAELRKANKEAEKEAEMNEAQDKILEDLEDETPEEPLPASFEAPAGLQEAEVVRTPAVTRSVASDEPVDPKDREKLPGWGQLTEEERGKVLSAVKEGDTWNVTYSVKARGRCGACGHKSPETFAHCPSCGSSFDGTTF